MEARQGWGAETGRRDPSVLSKPALSLSQTWNSGAAVTPCSTRACVSPAAPQWVGGGSGLVVEVPPPSPGCACTRSGLPAAGGPVGMAPPAHFEALSLEAGCEDSEVGEEQEGAQSWGVAICLLTTCELLF